jgi:hypothetical protein
MKSVAKPADAGKPEITSLSSNELISRLCDARDQIDRGIALVNEALDLREQFEWGVTDIDDARDAVYKLVCSIESHRRSRT